MIIRLFIVIQILFLASFGFSDVERIYSNGACFEYVDGKLLTLDYTQKYEESVYFTVKRDDNNICNADAYKVLKEAGIKHLLGLLEYLRILK